MPGLRASLLEGRYAGGKLARSLHDPRNPISMRETFFHRLDRQGCSCIRRRQCLGTGLGTPRDPLQPACGDWDYDPQNKKIGRWRQIPDLGITLALPDRVITAQLPREAVLGWLIHGCARHEAS